jgi:hypothetical protein
LTIYRLPRGSRNLAVRYAVLLDRKRIGLVARGEQLSLHVQPGVHLLRMRLQGTYSRRQRFEIRSGEAVKFVCAQAGSDNFLSDLYRYFVVPHRHIELYRIASKALDDLEGAGPATSDGEVGNAE